MSHLKSVSVRYDDEFDSNGYDEDLFEDPELFSLLEQILSEVFQVEDEESTEALCGNAIYFLEDEQSIRRIEKSEQIKLDEGSSNVEDLDSLLIEATDYFKNPNYSHTTEDDQGSDYLTCFIQIYSGVTFNGNGEMISKWKSIDHKVQIELRELLLPELLIYKIEQSGIKWTELVRVMIYGPGLEKLVGNRFYEEDESKELVPLSDEFPNILLAIPNIEFELDSEESIFEFTEREINEGIPFGIIPDFGRVTLGHWEWTHIRLLELQEEEMEERVLKTIELEEKFRAKEMNDFINKYKDAKDFIKGLNNKVIDPVEVYSLSLEMLNNILFVTEKLNFRLSDSAHYYQIKALYTKSKVSHISTQATQALSIIEKINKGDHVDFHLISMATLEDIFAILWSGTGIKIHSSKKEHYFTLKDSLLRMRANKARDSKK